MPFEEIPLRLRRFSKLAKTQTRRVVAIPDSNDSTDCPGDELAAADACHHFGATRSTFAGCDVGEDVSAESITFLTVFGNISSVAASIFALTSLPRRVSQFVPCGRPQSGVGSQR